MAFSLHSMLLKNSIASPEDRAEADVTARLLNDNGSVKNLGQVACSSGSDRPG